VAIPITLSCECGQTHSADLGDTVTCSCGRTYETSTLPASRFAHVQARQAKIRLYLQLGFIFVAGVAAVTGLLWGLKGLALGIPLSGLVWFLFLGKWYRRRWLLDPGERAPVVLEASDR
jgi:hypothetical protein